MVVASCSGLAALLLAAVVCLDSRSEPYSGSRSWRHAAAAAAAEAAADPEAATPASDAEVVAGIQGSVASAASVAFAADYCSDLVGLAHWRCSSGWPWYLESCLASLDTWPHRPLLSRSG